MSDDDRLADELASLRIQRQGEVAAPPRRGEPRNTGTGRRSGVVGWIVGAALLALLGVGGFFIFREGSGRMFPEEVELGSVSLMSPAQQDVTLVATGYVYARKKATVAPKVIGRLSRLLVDENDVVKDGQLIAELESADAAAQLAQVRADIAAARAKVERARADVSDANTKFVREGELLKRGAGTQSAFDDAQARLATTKAQLDAAQADVRSVEARQSAVSVTLENTKVRAPFAGTVIRKLTEVGEVVGASNTTGTAGIVTLADLTNLEVQADVSESQISKVKVGTPAEILLDAVPDKRFRGEVSSIRQTVDRAKAAVTVKVKFTDQPAGVVPDMAAKVSFLTRALDAEALKAAPKLVAPADAIVDKGNGKRVVLAVDDGHVSELAVAVGAPTGSLVELTSGPSPGTRIIRHPDPKLHEGSAVKEKKK
ncbi:MAG TPA: efflux RND transporter periplasmic adaptor subunit [Kofleriaceae bacterium]|nr:efflux RND transporter periplasmic adaptor subunit [Kofleriaceae bacterium]